MHCTQCIYWTVLNGQVNVTQTQVCPETVQLVTEMQSSILKFDTQVGRYIIHQIHQPGVSGVYTPSVSQIHQIHRQIH